VNEPPFPICPTCGRNFQASGHWRPRGSLDVVAFFHSREPGCDDVYGSADDCNGSLVRVGTTSDYRGDLARRFEESSFVFDLQNRVSE